MKNLDSINKDQGVYVLKCGDGFSCLGFEVVKRKAERLALELGETVNAKYLGTKKMLREYYRLVEIARTKNEETNWRSQSELYKPFIGHEGRRVEVVYNWDEKERFNIGRSTGFIPCHIAVKQKNSTGGGGVMADSIKSFTFIN